MNSVNVTIVVCTYNRADMLRRALGSLTVLETDGNCAYEVLVVNNGSRDHTVEVVNDIARHSAVPVRMVEEPRQGVAVCRNRGVAAARGEWLAFFDDDQLADPRWLVELLATAHKFGAQCVSGARTLLLPVGTSDELAPFCRTLLGEDCGGYVSSTRYGNKAAPGTGNLLVHRSVFDAVGVFDESLSSGEDTCLYFRMQRAGIPVWYTPHAVVEHIIPRHRLDEAYLRWTCLRHGWNGAQLDIARRTAFSRLLIFTARLGQAVCVHLPRLALARVLGRDAHALHRRCLLARAEGYARGTLRWWAPRLLRQRSFAARLDFHKERQQFAHQVPAS